MSYVEIITYLSNGKSIEKFNSFADAYDEWKEEVE